MEELGQRLCRLRKERGLSQEELADALGVTRQAVSKWENGTSQPDLDRLVALSAFFGCTLDQLVKGERREVPDGAGERPADDAGAEQAAAPPGRGRRNVLALALLICGGVSAIFLCRGHLIYLSAYLVLAGLLCLYVREHLGLHLGWTAWLFVLQWCGPWMTVSPAIALRPSLYPHYAPISVILSWVMLLVPAALLLLTLRARRGKLGGRRTLVRLGLLALVLIPVRMVWGYVLPAVAFPDGHLGHIPWTYTLTGTVIALCLLTLIAGGRKTPFLVLGVYLLSVIPDMAVNNSLSDHPYLSMYWYLLLFLIYLALSCCGVCREKESAEADR